MAASSSTTRDSDLVRDAHLYMRDAHAGQSRKGNGGPYARHPQAVAEVLEGTGYGPEVIAAAMLHDVLEETERPGEELAERFGGQVASLVEVLSDDESIRDYEDRKREHRARVEQAGEPATAIYAADKLCNVRDLRELHLADPERASGRFPVPLESRIGLWEEDLRMLASRSPGLPFLEDLEVELKGLAADRRGRESARPG